MKRHEGKEMTSCQRREKEEKNIEKGERKEERIRQLIMVIIV
jgi:hypothetical protein